MRRLITLHIDKTRLTPELVEVLRSIQEQYEKPTLRLTQAGLTVSVESWNNNLY